MNLPALYLDVSQHKAHVEQYRCLLRLGQEHYPYRRALELARPGDRLLDWGCGNGHLSYFLSRHGFAVDAYDATVGNFSGEQMPRLLQDAPGVKFTLGSDTILLPYESNTFDLIFCAGVLEHVHEFGGNQRRSILELERVLKPGGRLWVYHLPNRYSWNENARAVLNRLGFGPYPIHSAQYSRRDFEHLLADTRLVIEEAERYHFLPRIALERLTVANWPAFCAAFDAVDDALSFLLGPIAQNWSFITRKSP